MSCVKDFGPGKLVKWLRQREVTRSACLENSPWLPVLNGLQEKGMQMNGSVRRSLQSLGTETS